MLQLQGLVLYSVLLTLSKQPRWKSVSHLPSSICHSSQVGGSSLKLSLISPRFREGLCLYPFWLDKPSHLPENFTTTQLLLLCPSRHFLFHLRAMAGRFRVIQIGAVRLNAISWTPGRAATRLAKCQFILKMEIVTKISPTKFIKCTEITWPSLALSPFVRKACTQIMVLPKCWAQAFAHTISLYN